MGVGSGCDYSTQQNRRPLQCLPTRTAFLIASAIGATVALPLLAKAGPAPAPTFTAEKCFGVALAGHNDCGATGSHSCAGEATQDRRSEVVDLRAGRHLPEDQRGQRDAQSVTVTLTEGRVHGSK